jgi:hypothetical protein
MTETTVETEVVKKSKPKAEVDFDTEVEEIKPVKKTKSAPKTKKTVKAKEPEPEEESDDESEDEELDVDEVVIDGETYFQDEKGTIYDPDTQAVVGENGELYE